MSQLTPVTVDCRGMKCPAPILAVSRAARAAGEARTDLEVLADDPDFPVDVRAWCRTTGAALGDILEEGGVYTASLQLNPEASAAEPAVAAAAPEVAAAAPVEAQQESAPPALDDAVEVDCRGMCCPAPILQLAKAFKAFEGSPGILRVQADDGDFPVDLKAWCRSTKSELHSLDEVDGVFTGIVLANGAALEAAPEVAPAAPPVSVDAAPAVAEDGDDEPASEPLDLRGVSAQRAVLEASAWLLGGAEVRVLCDAKVAAHLQSWDPLAGVRAEEPVARDGHVEVTLAPSDEEVPAEVPVARAPVPVAAPAAVVPATANAVVAAPPEVPRRNATTLLVLRNDFESLMAAMMVANSSAAQGMEVDVYFSFWGVNFLRADSPRAYDEETDAGGSKPTFLHAIMKWMMPKGPERQKMSKMHMGGMGLGMMKHFMSKQNVMGLRELMDQAVELGVTFRVCTMSMGIMGIEKRDLMDLPNIEFGGVTAFTSDARTSASAMVF